MDERTCSGPECERPVGNSSATGLCRSHYKQWHLGKELAPLLVATRDLGRPKVCTFPECGRPHKARGLCKQHNQQAQSGRPLMPIKQYGKGGACKVLDCDGTRVANEMCTKHNAARVTRWKFYGITEADALRIYEAQGRGCAVCATPMPLDKLHVDHDHKCCKRGSCGRCVRGFLCQGCNIALGYMRDDPERLISAANYVRSTATQ